MQKTEEQHLHFCSTDSEQELKINWQCWVVNLSFMRIEKLLQGNLLQGLTHFVCLGRMQFQIKHKERGLRLNFDSLSFLSSFVLESLLLDAGNFAASQKIQCSCSSLLSWVLIKFKRGECYIMQFSCN